MSSKKKPGRKPTAGAKRTPSGRLSRAADAYTENIDPILTRMRMFGFTETEARDQKAESYIGRLYLTGQLGKKPYSDFMWDASQAYREAYEHYQRAVKSPDALRSSGGGGDQGESETYDRWCRSAVARWDSLKRAISNEQCTFVNRGTNLLAALDYIVLRNQEHLHMVGDVRVALNAVAHHLGMMARKAA